MAEPAVAPICNFGEWSAVLHGPYSRVQARDGRTLGFVNGRLCIPEAEHEKNAVSMAAGPMLYAAASAYLDEPSVKTREALGAALGRVDAGRRWGR